jgi:hypothetical protein
MCMFCAAIPAATAMGAALNNKQNKAKKQAETAGVQKPQTRPVLGITAGTVVLLLLGSVIYHTLTFRP